MTSTLVLLRHAKSAYPSGVPDHDRPLNGRGRRDAPVAGQLLAEAVGRIDLALVSTALRAQMTFDLASASLSVGRRRDEPGLYLASPKVMLEYVRRCEADTVLLVAHNPGTEDLAEALSGVGQAKFPTAAFAVLCADAPFSGWKPGCARLAEFTVARG